jgi:hypothetical protein
MGKATREAPAQAELRPTSAGACGVKLPYDLISQNCSVASATNSIRGELMGKVTREAPVRAEPHPTEPGSGAITITITRTIGERFGRERVAP